MGLYKPTKAVGEPTKQTDDEYHKHCPIGHQSTETQLTYSQVNNLCRSGRAERNPKSLGPVGFREVNLTYKINSK